MYIIGMSLGQFNQWTALTVLEKIEDGAKGSYNLVKAERLPMGSTYPAITQHLKELHEKLGGKDTPIAVDITGTGQAPAKLLWEAELSPVLVTITNGVRETQEGAGYSVPKLELVGALQVCLQEGRLKIAEALPETMTLARELTGFQMEARLKAQDSTEEALWRENKNDDYVFAVAVAVWEGERYQPGGSSIACVGRQRVDIEGNPIRFPIVKKGRVW